MPPTIREFRLADYAPVADLWTAAAIRVEPLEDVERKLERDADLFLVAEEEGRIVGVVLGTYDGRSGSINRLAVAEPHRRSGLASRLVANVEERLRNKGARRVWAWIEDHNLPSRQLFARLGFDEWPHVVTVAKALR